jgi:hypothetical protein
MIFHSELMKVAMDGKIRTVRSDKGGEFMLGKFARFHEICHTKLVIN